MERNPKRGRDKRRPGEHRIQKERWLRSARVANGHAIHPVRADSELTIRDPA